MFVYFGWFWASLAQCKMAQTHSICLAAPGHLTTSTKITWHAFGARRPSASSAAYRCSLTPFGWRFLTKAPMLQGTQQDLTSAPWWHSIFSILQQCLPTMDPHDLSMVTLLNDSNLFVQPDRCLGGRATRLGWPTATSQHSKGKGLISFRC